MLRLLEYCKQELFRLVGGTAQASYDETLYKRLFIFLSLFFISCVHHVKLSQLSIQKLKARHNRFTILSFAYLSYVGKIKVSSEYVFEQI